MLTRAQRWPAGSVPPDAAPAVRTRWQAMAWLRPAALSDLFWPLLLGLPPLMLAFVWPGTAAALAGRAGPAAHRAGAGTGRGRSGSACEHPDRAGVVALSAGLAGITGLAVDRALAVERRPVGNSDPVAGRRPGDAVATGVGAGESGWLRYGGSSAALAGAFGWAAWAGWTLWRWQQPDPWLNGRRARWGFLRLLGGLGLALLAAQAAFGDEGGWARFQPFELTKLAPHHGSGLRFDAARTPVGTRLELSPNPSLWLRYLGPVTLLLAVSGFCSGVPARLFHPWCCC